MKCLPAIDILDGKCVRLTKGDFDKSKIYNGSPLDQAKIFENAGFKEEVRKLKSVIENLQACEKESRLIRVEKENADLKEEMKKLMNE